MAETNHTTTEQLTGKQFGRLLVVEFSHEPVPYRRFWHCLCACGQKRIIREDYIKTNNVTCRVCRRNEIAARQSDKHCSNCNQSLPRSEFYKDNSTTDKLSRYCKTCKRRIGQRIRARLQRRRPEDIPIPDTKKCSTCGIVQPNTEFYTDRTQINGLSKQCSECQTQYRRQWYVESGRNKMLSKRRTARYGISLLDLDEMIKRQNNQCAICHREFINGKFYIDHNHSTGKVRELLCPCCNTGIGLLGESVEVLHAAIAYIEKHRQ